MPKGPKITNEVKKFIAEVNEKHPDWIAKKVMVEVQAQLRRVNHQVKPDWPGLSAVQIELKKIRQRKIHDEPSGIDSRWSAGALGEYDIPSEAIPKVLEIQGLRLSHEPLTIREARWIGHLHAVTGDIMELATWAALYASREKICEQADIEKDTTDLDLAVHSKLVTILGYFPWLFQKGWVPDLYKKRMAEEQTLKYENVWGLKLDRPEFTLNGWLVYSHSLQYMVLYDKEKGELPKELQEILVLSERQVAKNEGRILMATPGKYLDLMESITKGVVCEKSYSNIEEVFDASSTEELKKGIDKLLGSKVMTVREAQHERSHNQEG
jgi:hypothetical protein